MLRRISAWAPASEPLSDVITLDFINTALEPGARAGIELTLETAKELRAALDRAIAAAEFEEAEVRGKGAVPRTSGQRDTRDERVARASAAAVAVGEGRRQSFSTLIDDFNTPG